MANPLQLIWQLKNHLFQLFVHFPFDYGNRQRNFGPVNMNREDDQ